MSVREFTEDGRDWPSLTPREMIQEGAATLGWLCMAATVILGVVAAAYFSI